MRKSILFYVSGHGLGHAGRVAEVVRALASLQPDAVLHARTAAPQTMFSGIQGVRYSTSTLDSGAVEDDALQINPRKTLERAAELLRNADEIISSEVSFIQDNRVSLVVSDIPFLAGDIAQAAGVPCLALGNFTWDWIYEPWVLGVSGLKSRNTASHETPQFPEYSGLVERIRESYSRMQAYLRLPFSHPVSVFHEVIDTSLVARRSLRDKNEVIEQLHLDPTDPRPRVLIGMRGGVSQSVLASAAETGQDYLFIVPGEIPHEIPENVVSVTPTPETSFTDVLNTCDVVVSKFGYGILADCVAAKVALLWPRRSGFREDEIMEVEATRYIRAKEIPLPDFHSGAWSDHLDACMKMPAPPEDISSGGAEFCAKIISQRML